MKRIHPVGKSRDNRKLYLAHQQSAKFGSMELSIGPKLRTLLRAAEAERLAKRGKRLPEDELEEARRAARSAEARARQAGARAQKAWERQKEAEDLAREADRKAGEAEERAAQAERRAQAAERGAMAATARRQEPEEDLEGVGAVIRVPQRRPDEAGPSASERPEAEAEVPSVPAVSGEPDRAEEPEAPEPPRERVDLAPDSTLTPAEIQTLLRAGRGIRSVAKQAEAPIDWVRRLAAPIEAERLGVVTQLLRSYVIRSRLGRSALPVGPAIVENLRDKGVRFPERIAELGWTAWRPDGREWRVRFVYESRGRRQRADWLFDPQSRVVTPQNNLAQELGFRAPQEEDGMGRQTAEANAAAIRPKRISGSRSGAGSGRTSTGKPSKKKARSTRSGGKSPGAKKRSRSSARSTRARGSSAKKPSRAKRSGRTSGAKRGSRKRSSRRSGGSGR